VSNIDFTVRFEQSNQPVRLNSRVMVMGQHEDDFWYGEVVRIVDMVSVSHPWVGTVMVRSEDDGRVHTVTSMALNPIEREDLDEDGQAFYDEMETFIQEAKTVDIERCNCEAAIHFHFGVVCGDVAQGNYTMSNVGQVCDTCAESALADDYAARFITPTPEQAERNRVAFERAMTDMAASGEFNFDVEDDEEDERVDGWCGEHRRLRSNCWPHGHNC
jgi:hypothetical protein